MRSASFAASLSNGWEWTSNAWPFGSYGCSMLQHAWTT